VGNTQSGKDEATLILFVTVPESSPVLVE